jgi:hypothetical protein
MHHLVKTIEELSSKAALAGKRTALIGMDGFVDRILHVVGRRHGRGDQFTAIPTIAEFGARVTAAAGTSANFEMYPVLEKLGGNGPIMAQAILSQGVATRYIGALGQPVHPVFTDFARRTDAISIAEPGITEALEFDDGKLMLGVMAGLDAISYQRMIEVMGEGALFDAFNRASVIGLVNWTMVPGMTALIEDILTRLLPNLGPLEHGRLFFFDLTDPAKRSSSDLRAVLQSIRRYRTHGAVTLGLNLAEARQVAAALNLGEVADTPDGLQAAATRIRATLDLTTAVIHPREGAACATRDGAWHVAGPLSRKPRICTGAGDHFNAGFAVAQAIGLSPVAALSVAVATSGQYVRTAQSPSLAATTAFIEDWTQGRISD